jgi:hypothetical protein
MKDFTWWDWLMFTIGVVALVTWVFLVVLNQ